MEKMERLEYYKKMGLKMTPQRFAILEYLENNRNHPSAEEIFNALKDQFPSMSIATVYNTLEVLVAKGLVKELNIDPTKKRFDPITKPHHHFICKKCGKIIDIEKNFDIALPEELKDCEVFDSQVIFSGLCSACKVD